MNMISAQIDELREMAESVGLAMPQAATLMMEAADTITELRGALSVASADYRHLSDENAKLRELAKLTVFIIETMESVTSWRFEGDGKVIDSAYLWDKLRELGVEVDG